MKILTDQMLSADQDEESFSDSICAAGCFAAGKRKGKKKRENGRKPGNESSYRICLPEEEIPENSVLYYYIEDEMSPEELELLQSTVAINQYLSAEKQGRSWLIWSIKAF